MVGPSITAWEGVSEGVGGEEASYPVVVDDFGDDGDFTSGGAGVEEDDWDV